MCLGDMFGSLLAPCVGCCKYAGSGAGLGLVFTAALVGIDLAADWPIVLILIACIVALIWFIVMACEIKDKDEEEFAYLVRYLDPICDPKYNVQSALELNDDKHNYSHELAASLQQIDKVLIDIFIVMLWYAFVVLVTFVLLTIWFIPDGTAFGFLFGLLFGAIAITLLTWAAFKFAARSLSRVLLSATEFKEEAFVLMYNVGYSTILLALGCVYFFFVICFLLFKAGIVEGLPDDKNEETITSLGICCCGYAMGVIVPGFVYREAASILSRSIFNSIDGLVKTDKNLNFNNPYISHPTKIAYVIQSLISNLIVNILDASFCLVVLTVSAFVILSNSAETLAEDITYKSLLSPTIYVSVNILCSVIVQLFKTWDDDGEVAAFTMYNCRIQVILTNIVSFIIFLVMPMATFLDEFTVKGKADESVQNEALTINKVAWACIMGQLCNVSLICYIEWLTSHGCSPVRNLSLASNERNPVQHINYAHYIGGFGGLGSWLIIGLTTIIVYGMCGWLGFMAAAAGFLINLVIYVAILYIGIMSSDCHKLSCMGIVSSIMQDRLYKMAWAARNYSIYVKITTAGGSFFLALCFLGCSIFFFEKDPTIFLKGVGLFGIIIGIAITFMYRGWTIGAIIHLSKTYVSSQDLDVFKSGVAVEVAQDDTIFYFLRHKLWVTMKFVYSMFVFSTILIFLIGFFFGYQAMIGLLIGNIVMTLFFMFHSITAGSSLRNARYFNEANDQMSKQSVVYNQYVYGDIQGTVVEESSSIPLMIYLLYNSLLITICHTFFARDGDVFEEKKE